jgi:radical SAM superfamily enzyme YgiQ (UPF0313 family)
MKILLCSIPDGSLERTLKPLIPRGNHMQFPPISPAGILQINSWIEENGYNSDVYDINNLRPSDKELIKNFKRANPAVVGLSAPLSHCYPNVKRITKILRELFPDIWIVVGGHLTGSSNVVLQKTETDICVVGDGEIPFLKLLDYFKLHPTRRQLDFTGLSQIKGLAFIDQDNKLKVTGNAEQLPASDMPYPNPDGHKSGLQKFGGNGELINEFFEPINDLSNTVKSFIQGQLYPEGLRFYEKNKNKKIGYFRTVRGCVARCTFCQRYTKGYRIYEHSELENQIIKLKEKYNVRGLYLGDENALSNRVQSYEMARIFKKHDIYWVSGGVRVTSVTYEDLKFYKEHNMLAIRFGIESGSQKILNIMEKKFTTKDVYNAISNCKKVGISTAPDAIMIGMPGETRETVIESATFIASLRYLLGKDWNIGNPFMAMAIPGTPLYEYCQQIGLIGKTVDEEEDYLIRLSEHKNTHILNYVNKTSSNINEVHYWKYLFPYAAKKAYVDLIINNNQSIKNRLLQIYEKCIKSELNGLIDGFDLRKKSFRNKKLLNKIKSLTLIFINFLLSLSALFLPKAVLFPIVRVYASLRFNVLIKNHKLKTGKQKHNFFTSQPVDSTNNFRLTENKIVKANRQINLSLRKVVMENRKKMRPAITEEEIGLQILAQGQ